MSQKSKTVLVISTHPDDEALGCAGTILRHRAEGDTVHWLIATVAFEPQWSKVVIQTKAEEVERVVEAYGMASVHKLNQPTTRLETLPQSVLIDGVRAVVEKVRPEIVYLVHDGDVHTDHHAVFTAALSVLKAFYMKQYGVQRILSYETLSSTEAAPPQFSRAFIPNVYRDITPFLSEKLKIMEMYASETQPDPFPRGASAIQALARYRGATVGVEYAEAFMLIREVA